jgi:hypothetical protein
MGDATDLERPGVRWMLVNAVYWAVGLEHKISPDSHVSVVGEYQPCKFALRSKEGMFSGSRAFS